MRDVRGEALLPLSALKGAFPEIYERETVKYVGREALTREPPAPLDCLWSDVLFCSPVHPGPLPNAARLDPQRACIRFVQSWTDGLYLPPHPQDDAPFTPEALAQVSRAPAITLSRLGTLPPQAPLILWADVPHVLYRGPVPLDMLGVVLA